MNSARSAVAFIGGSLSQPPCGSHLGTARPKPVAAVLEQEAAHDPTTTLPLYGALLGQAVAKTLDVDDSILSARHPFFRYPLEEPFELLSELLLEYLPPAASSRPWPAASPDPSSRETRDAVSHANVARRQYAPGMPGAG